MINNPIINRLNKLALNKRFQPVFDILLFIFITLIIHYVFKYWERQLHYRLFGYQILTPEVYDFFTNIVFNHTRLVVNALLPVDIIERTFYFSNQCSVSIVAGCSGIKQMLQLALLILIYPGPWKHKAWFIPSGMLIVHLTNVFRLSGLCIVMNYWPQHWHFAHDYPFRVIFYVVIFFLWVIWNDKFYHRKEKPISRLAD